MPKFISRKNPFRSEVRPSKRSAETDPAVVPAVATPVAAPAPQPSPATVPSQPQAPAAPGRVRRALSGLRNRSARFFAWLSRPRPAAAKPAVPRFEPLPIQGELSLDRIQVVRNDLSDADLELVPRTPPEASAAGRRFDGLADAGKDAGAPGAPAPAEKAGAARMAWNRAGRLLGAMKT